MFDPFFRIFISRFKCSNCQWDCRITTSVCWRKCWILYPNKLCGPVIRRVLPTVIQWISEVSIHFFFFFVNRPRPETALLLLFWNRSDKKAVCIGIRRRRLRKGSSPVWRRTWRSCSVVNKKCDSRNLEKFECEILHAWPPFSVFFPSNQGNLKLCASNQGNLKILSFEICLNYQISIFQRGDNF